jgi:hypothetical protein
MARGSRSVVLLAAALVTALAAPTFATGKRKPPPPPPPPPDTAADCSLVVEPSISDYLVLSTLNVEVRCATTKQTITVTGTSFTRDGVEVPMIPFDTRTCSNTDVCVFAIDLFSYDTTPVAFPGDQRYCVSGFGVVGGQLLGPGSACENDARL